MSTFQMLGIQVTAFLLRHGVIYHRRPSTLYPSISAAINNNTLIAKAANETDGSVSNITEILYYYHRCLKTKILQNKTQEAWNCFHVAEKNNEAAVICDFVNVEAGTLLWLLLVAMVMLFILSFLKSRKSCCLKCCYGRPGCVIPLNMLDSYENRFGNALAFGTMTIRCITLVLKDNSRVFGTALTAVFESQNVPSFVSVFVKILATIVVASSHYPLFACMVYENKIIGCVLGILFALAGLSSSVLYVSLIISCYQKDVLIITSLINEIPVTICLLLILVKFVFELQRAVKCWNRKKTSKILKPTEVPGRWKEQYMYKHVQNLLKGTRNIGCTFLENFDDEEINLKEKLRKKLYTFKPEFKYSKRVICALTISSYTAIMVIVAFVQVFWYTSHQILNFINSAKFRALVGGDTTTIKNIKDYFYALRTSYYVATACTALVLIFVFMNMLKWYRKHIMQLRKGDKKWLPSSIVRGEMKAANVLASSMKYAGYQIGYTFWGTIILIFVFWIVIGIIATLVVTPLRHRTWSPLLRLLYNLWPGLLLTLVINFLQVLSAKYFFLHDQGASLSINNRNAYHVMSFYMFFFNIPLGLISCLLRIGMSVIVGIFFLTRLNKSLLPRSFEKMDPGYMAYLSYIFVEHTHANPVACIFTALLIESRYQDLNLYNVGAEMKSGGDSTVVLQTVSTTNSTADLKQSMVARNRWFVALTLLRNPSLQESRSPVPKLKSVNTLVKSIARPFSVSEVQV